MQPITQAVTGSTAVLPILALLGLAVLIAAALAVCCNPIAQNDERARAAERANTYCHLTQFEIFRYVLAARLNAARVAR